MDLLNILMIFQYVFFSLQFDPSLLKEQSSLSIYCDFHCCKNDNFQMIFFIFVLFLLLT